MKVSFSLSVLAATLVAGPAAAQQATTSASVRAGAPLVYLDCRTRGCDDDFFRDEIRFVNYVRDRTSADVQVLVTSQGTGGGGSEYTLHFIGRNGFEGQADTLRYVAPQSATEDDRRRGLAHVIKLGLIRYAAQSPLASAIQVEFETPEGSAGGNGEAAPIEDPWDYWVFGVDMNGSAEIASAERQLDFGMGLSANRTTADWKLEFGLRGGYEEQRYEFQEDGAVVVEREVSRDLRFNLFVANSLGPHLSVGIRGGLDITPGGLNPEEAMDFGPAIEYSVFPYSQSNRRSLLVRYSTTAEAVRYRELTILNKLEDVIYEQNLTISYDTRQPWGSAGIGLDVSHYLNYPDRYNIGLDGDLDIQLTDNLDLELNASGERVNDQFDLPLDEVDIDDILLNRGRLPTSYQYEFRIGLGYTFGSIFNNVVNPRLDFDDFDDFRDFR